MQTRKTVLHCSLKRRSFRGSVPLPGFLPWPVPFGRLALVRKPTKRQQILKANGPKTTSKQRHKLNHVHIGGGRPWVVSDRPEKQRHIRAVTLKKGDWLGIKEDLIQIFEIPYFDTFGKNSGCTLYTARMTQQDYIATLIATVSRRLLCWTRSHSKLMRKEQAYLEDLIARCSTLYVLTKNSYLIDRILVLTKDFRKNKSFIKGIIARFASKLDANKGFIYSQACSHAHWLTTRAKRPRDKSSPTLHAFPLRKVGCTDFSKRKVWIFDAIYRVSTGTRYLGSTFYSILRPSFDSI